MAFCAYGFCSHRAEDSWKRADICVLPAIAESIFEVSGWRDRLMICTSGALMLVAPWDDGCKEDVIGQTTANAAEPACNLGKFMGGILI